MRQIPVYSYDTVQESDRHKTGNKNYLSSGIITEISKEYQNPTSGGIQS